MPRVSDEMHRLLLLAIAVTVSVPRHAESSSVVGPIGGQAAVGHAAVGLATTPPAVLPTDSVWVFTNRARVGSEWQQARGPLTHLVRGFQVTPIRPDPVPYEVRLSVRATHERALSQNAMLEALRAELAHGDGAMVLHVHGYATSLDEATEEAAEMRQRGAFTGPMAVFAWPAHSVGVTWPAPGKVFTNAYWQDARAATESADDLAHLLLTLVGTVGAERIVVSAHSMGNQLLAQALSHPDVRVALSHAPLRAIVFASPDVDREQFRDEVVPAAEPLARRRVLYGARDDHMLRMSALVHNGRHRAGLLDQAFIWPATLEVVDITEGRVAAPWFGAWFDTNHALRRHGTALTDLFTIVAGNAPAAMRCALGFMAPDASGAWQALDAPLPARPWMQHFASERAATAAVCA